MADSAPLKIIQGTALTGPQKKDLLHRLARVEGQLRGVQKLIAKAAEPADCEAIAQQMSAARKALDRSFVTLLTSAIVTHTGAEGGHENQAERVLRLAALLDKFA
ncbi:metal-sensitive transcriptional regulator [Undibacterium sp.]|jgi:DNA-binding FrmR family transcriptional regulator|uniref:metal-sensitive transcriptional regulator n=1 Tax=Undibacterium sp. TaxID=1914977 RepID=UPI002C6835D7|nr:metal-sensing transcriptional repressor [Undibacterium sp.]HTD06203.1 metal-sensing transcriptional repressor [Undibacterium sp.]